ncbi:hypothetical protein GW17_00052024 [Ensete ventricosum]|nr:hypothetical protein GW17_00052024 [Ensete ventricosum]
MAGAGGSCDKEGNVRWPTTGAGATVAAGNHLAAAKAATWEAAVTEVTTRWVRLEATCGGGYGHEAVESTGSVRNNFSPHAGFHRYPMEEQREKDQTMPGDRCRSRWFHRQRRQRTGAWQGRKKGQRSGNWLEEAATAAGGRCWDGKEYTTKEGDDEEDGRPGRWTSEGYHWYRKRASAVDSIMSGACLLLERETYTDGERVALGAEDVQESGDG